MNSTKKKSMKQEVSRYQKVMQFNQEILGIEPRVLGLQDPAEAALSYTQMREEAEEFKEAIGNTDFIGTIDAVLDELYFCYGILYKSGITEEMADDMFSAIHNANMSKKKGVKEGREGYDAADAGKPKDWVDPRKVMEEIIDAHIDNH